MDEDIWLEGLEEDEECFRMFQLFCIPGLLSASLFIGGMLS